MAHFFRHILLGLLPLSALLSCTPNDPPARLYEQEKVLMGTVFKFKSAVSSISEDSVRQSYKDAFREIARLESQLSEWIEESPVSRPHSAPENLLYPSPLIFSGLLILP